MASERKVRVIPSRETFGDMLPKRACAYVRVSTGHDAQLESFQNQTEYYERKIRGDPGFVFCGIYSDAGYSGSREDRPGFLAMMDAARRGLVDVILTKAISRFARNTETLLRCVRELRELGVSVRFEEQGIDTMGAQGEMLLNLLASVAEEERRSVRKNIQWSLREGYRQGKHTGAIHCLMGYCKGADGRVEIDPEQAEVVRWIFVRYLAGESAAGIACELNREQVPWKIDLPWSGQCILRIVSNERYAGDCLLQKSFIEDMGLQVRNRGQLERYYVQGHHPAIVSRGDWEAALRRREERKPKKYPFTSMLRCSRCGATLIRIMPESKRVQWVCATYLHQGKATCAGTRLPDKTVQELHALHPITQPMVVQEDEDAKRTGVRTLEHYHFFPATLDPGR